MSGAVMSPVVGTTSTGTDYRSNESIGKSSMKISDGHGRHRAGALQAPQRRAKRHSPREA